MSDKIRVLLLASYCGNDNPDCTSELPCDECIAMCNVAVVEATKVHVLGELDFLKAAADGQSEDRK